MILQHERSGALQQGATFLKMEGHLHSPLSDVRVRIAVPYLAGKSL